MAEKPLAHQESPKADSVIRLLPYQQRFFADRSRVVVACWCRQAGKDFAAACKAVDDAMTTGRDWFIVSLTQRQADATFDKCRKIAEAFKKVLRVIGLVRSVDGEEYVDYDAEIDQHFRCRARKLELPGGGSVTSLPGRNPDVLAGLTGSVIFTEFGLFPKGGYDHWRVIFPLSTRGYQVVVISTPRGKNARFFELVQDAKTYSVHTVDIHRAVAEGLTLRDNNGRPCPVEGFRAIYKDEAGWKREYLLEFSGDLEALLKWAQLIDAASIPITDPAFRWLRVEGDAGWTAGFFADPAKAPGRLEIGWDVARTGHLSVVWVNQCAASAALPRRLVRLALMHKASFALQREVVIEAMAVKNNSVGCGDATGLGMDSNETLHSRFGDRWQPVQFTAPAKRELASALRTAFDDHDQAIPPAEGESKFIATDLYAVQADNTGGSLLLVEGDNPLLPESHCDLAWAAALARRAAAIKAIQPYISVLE